MEGGLGTDITVLVVSLAIIPAVFVILLLCLKVCIYCLYFSLFRYIYNSFGACKEINNPDF